MLIASALLLASSVVLISLIVLSRLPPSPHLHWNEVLSSPLNYSQECIRFINTRKYDETCHGISIREDLKLYPLLVTGLGGSGTHYLTRRLREELAVEIHHERLLTSSLPLIGAVSWTYAVNDVISQTIYPHHSQMSSSTSLSPRFGHVVHLIRCPLRQISSLTSHTQRSFTFIHDALLHTNITAQDQQLLVIISNRVIPSVISLLRFDYRQLFTKR